ncbi:hypothetical protein UCMB321_2914 [Pseudomonas batumici]|uniref:Uncharacterized protein n=1 Tax=Pseudomonas batumici TaxID=226910 RepID=A0A0C2EX92_9PSED|nr:hypothetical protein UCMB321_2914 [Pseudomonas batumici]
MVPNSLACDPEFLGGLRHGQSFSLQALHIITSPPSSGYPTMKTIRLVDLKRSK